MTLTQEADDVRVGELQRRVDKVENRLASDVIDARQFRVEMERIRDSIMHMTRETTQLQAKIEAVERDHREAEREQSRALRNLFYSIMVTLVTVLAGAVLTILRTGGV